MLREDMFEEAEGLDHPYFMTKHESEKLVRKECKVPWTVSAEAVAMQHDARRPFLKRAVWEPGRLALSGQGRSTRALWRSGVQDAFTRRGASSLHRGSG